MPFYLVKDKKKSANYRMAKKEETPCELCVHFMWGYSAGRWINRRCQKIDCLVSVKKTCDYAKVYNP